MSHEKVIVFLDRAMAFSFYAMIGFLPISIALIETFFGFILSFFFLKRGILFYFCLEEMRSKNIPISLMTVIKEFFLAFKPVQNYLNRPIGIFIFVVALSVLTSDGFTVGIKGFFFKLLEWTFLYFIFLECIKSKKQIQIFITIFLLSAILITIDGITQRFTGTDFIFHHHLSDVRVTASFRHSNDFAAYLSIVCLLVTSILLCSLKAKNSPNDFGAARFLYPSSLGRKFFALFLLLLFMVCLGLTLSRGAWFGFFAGLVVLMFLKRKILFFTIFVLAIFIIICVPYMKKERNMSLFAWQTYQKDFGRVDYWRESWRMIRDFPIFGVGFNAYSQIAPKYKIGWGGYPHNCYLQMAAETGLVGLFSFIWIIAMLFGKSLRNMQFIKDEFLLSILMGLLAGLFGFLLHSGVDTNFYTVQLGNLMWALMALIVAIQKVALDKGQDLYLINELHKNSK